MKRPVIVVARAPFGPGGSATFVRARAQAISRCGFDPDGFVIELRDAHIHADFADVCIVGSAVLPGGPIAVLEAMQAGRAIVTSGRDGVVEDLSDGAEGLLVPRGNRIELGSAIERLLEPAPLRRTFGGPAAARFRRQFSPDRFVAAPGSACASLGGFPG